MRRRARDDRHHACVDRQAYHAMGTLLLGWAAAGVLEWIGAPWWVALLVLVVLLLAVPALELAWDAEERRRARLTPADRAAGRW